MTKFRIGDKVRILDVDMIIGAVDYGYSNGDIALVERVNSDGAPYILNKHNPEGHLLVITSNELQYIEKVNKPTKNQRITALEKEVAELRSLKEKIEYLEKAVQQYFTVPGESSTVEDKPKLKGITIELEKTPNQQRKEIIEKAKGFVNFLVSYIGDRYDREMKYGNIDRFISIHIYNVKFEVNEQKRTVVALLIGKFSKVVHHCGIAKCMPGDVFNEHIGKAIALGRALRLNVREFEQAVQPTVAVGQLFVVKGNRPFKRRVGEITSMYPHLDDSGYGTAFRHTIDNGWLGEEQIKILNDTNAIYGGGE